MWAVLLLFALPLAQTPDPHVVARVAVAKGESIADIGAGDGYFTTRFLKRGAKVWAVDIDAEALAKLPDHPALTKVLAEPNDPKLTPAGSFDTLFFDNVAHHIADRPAYFAKAAEALKPEGRMVVFGFESKLSRTTLRNELKAAGYHIARARTWGDEQYLLEVRRKKSE